MKANTVLCVEDLQSGYEKKQILKNLSFRVEKGELVGIIGPNGAGKSTLLKTLMGILPLLAGQIYFDGQTINGLSKKAFAKKVAYLQQNVEIELGYTGEDVVAAGRYPYLNWWESITDTDKQIIKLCMTCTGVEKLAETPVNSVSGGQKQRILLAKVLAQQTPLMLLDEPSTGLDIVYQEEIFRFCQEMTKAGKTILMAVHEIALAARYCTRLLLISDGKLLADGTPEQVLQDDLISKAYHADLKILRSSISNNLEVALNSKTVLNEQQQEIIKKLCR